VKWIAVTGAATAGGDRLALLQSLKAAGAHSGSDVLAAMLIWARRRGRRHRLGHRHHAPIVIATTGDPPRA